MNRVQKWLIWLPPGCGLRLTQIAAILGIVALILFVRRPEPQPKPDCIELADCLWAASYPEQSVSCPACPETIRIPEPAPIEVCQSWTEISDTEFLRRALAAAVKAGASKDDVRRIRPLWFDESNHNRDAVSPKGAIGICQGHKPSHKWIDPILMMTNPEYAGRTCYRLYKEVRKCGEYWDCCYERGISGCRKYLRREGVPVDF